MGTVFGEWQRIVGADLAAHTKPEAFEDGELLVSADSPAWATQVRLLAPDLLRRLGAELGHGVVSRVRVAGPGAGGRRGSARYRRGLTPCPTRTVKPAASAGNRS